MPQAQGNVLYLLQGRLDSLSPQHRAVAKYLIAHADEAAFLNVAEIAGRTETSPATVVRFAKALGFSGFPEFQELLQALLRQRLAPDQRLQKIDGVPKTSGETLDRLEALAMENVHSTRRGLNPTVLETAASRIVAAETKYVIGLRASTGAATLLGHYLLQIQSRVVTLVQAGPALFENIAGVSENDIVIAISYPRYTRWTVDCLRVARERKATCIAITDSMHSPAAHAADITLVSTSETYTFGHSYVAVMFVVDALISAIVTLDRERALKRLESIEALLRAQDFFYVGLAPNQGNLNARAPQTRKLPRRAKGE